MGGMRMPFVTKPLADIDKEAVMGVANILGLAMKLNDWPDYNATNIQNLFLGLICGNISEQQLSSSMLIPTIDRLINSYVIWFASGALDTFKQASQLDENQYYQIAYEEGCAVLVDAQDIEGYMEGFLAGAEKDGHLFCIGDHMEHIADAKQAFFRARRSWYYAKMTGKHSGIIHSKDYQLHQFLADAMRSGVPLPTHALESIKRYDEKNGSSLFETLRVYVHANQDIEKISKSLNIHRNTVFYRLNCIKNLFAVDLHDAMTLRSYSIFVLLHDLAQMPYELATRLMGP